jgi:hypothetical protein
MSKETTQNQEATSAELTHGQAVNVLIQAARIAQTKGAFTLEDAEMVSKAIRVFVPPAPVGEDGTDPVVNEDITEPTEPVVMKVK